MTDNMVEAVEKIISNYKLYPKLAGDKISIKCWDNQRVVEVITKRTAKELAQAIADRILTLKEIEEHFFDNANAERQGLVTLDLYVTSQALHDSQVKKLKGD